LEVVLEVIEVDVAKAAEAAEAAGISTKKVRIHTS
jgi:hypothetical protein